MYNLLERFNASARNLEKSIKCIRWRNDVMNEKTTMEVLQKSNTQEALGQSKIYKFKNWYKNKVLPVQKKAVASVKKAFKKIPCLNWGAILVLVILSYMAQKGIMDDMPNIKWLLESTVRLVDWLFGLIRSICEWTIGVLDSEVANATDFFGIMEKFVNWMKGIFAL